MGGWRGKGRVVEGGREKRERRGRKGGNRREVHFV